MTPPIHQWPCEERPREKLLKKGEISLTDSELLAILLRTGSRGESAVDLARRIINRFQTFRNMIRATPDDWKNIHGLGPVKITQIKAAIEIGRRFTENETRVVRPAIRSSQDAVNILMPQMRDCPKEKFKTIFLDAKNVLIDMVTCAEGTVNQAIPFVRDIIHEALKFHAVSIICSHNHPSGDPLPSDQDRKFTREIIEAGKVMQIKTLDHIIIGDNCYFSFADKGEM